MTGCSSSLCHCEKLDSSPVIARSPRRPKQSLDRLGRDCFALLAMTKKEGVDCHASLAMTWLARARGWVQDERGLGLVESLAAVAILGVVVAAFVVALSSGTIAVRKGDQEVVAQSLAQTQLEYVKGYPYDPAATTYPTVDTPEGYSISVEVGSIPEAEGETNIQKITVTISRDGEDILIVEDYKVNR